MRRKACRTRYNQLPACRDRNLINISLYRPLDLTYPDADMQTKKRILPLLVQTADLIGVCLLTGIPHPSKLVSNFIYAFSFILFFIYPQWPWYALYLPPPE